MGENVNDVNFGELMGKQVNDEKFSDSSIPLEDKAIIVGAGPSGMATAACLAKCGVPYVILERSSCIASLWQKHTYDRLQLHTPKQQSELPMLPFPVTYPTFLSRKQFVDYLEDYAKQFNIKPQFSANVESAIFDKNSQTWRVSTSRAANSNDPRVRTDYTCRWLIVATGENADTVSPQLRGDADFRGTIIHSSDYRNGSYFANKRVLVVGSGNAGMEIALDLINSGATASIVVRSPLHVLPREMLGVSTFSIAMGLTKIFPVWLVDYMLVYYSQLRFGDTSAYGLRRPKVGPLELKMKMRKTPILDVGTLSRIQNGEIQVRPGIDHFTVGGARFVDGKEDSYDAVILATGYKSNVPSWLDDEDRFFGENGLPSKAFGSWKGSRGLYAAGLSGKGLLGASKDAQLIADDIREAYYISRDVPVNILFFEDTEASHDTRI